MRRTALFLALVLLLLCGCGAETPEAPLRVTVEYETAEQLHRSIRIDLEAKTKTVTEYGSGDPAEATEAFADPAALTAFLSEQVLPTMEAGAKNAAEELVLWRIRIETDKDSRTVYGVASEGYPEYWPELLKLIGE